MPETAKKPAVEKTAKKAREFKEVSSDFISLEEGKPVEGFLLKKDTTKFNSKVAGGEPSIVGKYTMQAEEDGAKPFQFLGSRKIDDLLDPIMEGTYVKITYLGEIKTGSNNKMKDYKLEVAI